MTLFIYQNLNLQEAQTAIHNSLFYCEIENRMFL